MNQPDAKVAEQLWLRAHEAIKRGNLPQAVRDLAKSFEILKAVGDPRVRQVHAKWVAVHKLYLEEKQGGGQSPAQASVDYKTIQAEAETAANAGNLDKAIELYEKVVAGQPENELAKERIAELRQAQTRAAELSGPHKAAPGPSAQPAAAQPIATQPAAGQPAAAEPVVAPAQTEQAAAQPAYTQPRVAEHIEQPVDHGGFDDSKTQIMGTQQQPEQAFAPGAVPATAGMGTPNLDSPEGQVAMLESLLAQVQQRRRSPS